MLVAGKRPGEGALSSVSSAYGYCSARERPKVTADANRSGRSPQLRVRTPQGVVDGCKRQAERHERRDREDLARRSRRRAATGHPRQQWRWAPSPRLEPTGRAPAPPGRGRSSVAPDESRRHVGGRCVRELLAPCQRTVRVAKGRCSRRDEHARCARVSSQPASTSPMRSDKPLRAGRHVCPQARSVHDIADTLGRRRRVAGPQATAAARRETRSDSVARQRPTCSGTGAARASRRCSRRARSGARGEAPREPVAPPVRLAAWRNDSSPTA